MNRSSLIRFGVIAALGLGILPAAAQQTKPAAAPAQPTTPPGSKLPVPSIGVVDLQAISRTSAASKSIREQLEKQIQTYQAEFQKRDADLRAAEQALQQQRASMAPEAFSQKRMTLETQMSDMQHEAEDRKRQIDEALNEAQSQVLQATSEVISQIQQERGLNLILRRDLIAGVSPDLDLTTEVLQRVDKKLPHVTVKLTAAPAANR